MEHFLSTINIVFNREYMFLFYINFLSRLILFTSSP